MARSTVLCHLWMGAFGEEALGPESESTVGEQSELSSSNGAFVRNEFFDCGLSCPHRPELLFRVGDNTPDSRILSSLVGSLFLCPVFVFALVFA